MHWFVSPNVVNQLGWVATKVAKPVKVHLTQGAMTLVSEVVLKVILECGKAKFAKNFMVYALDGMEAILRNTFLDIYLVNVLKGRSKLRIIVRLRNMSISLKVEHHATLAKINIHLVSLQELQDTSFLIFMRVDESSAKSKAKGAKFSSTCISNTINKFLDILIDDFHKHLPFYRNVDHKIKVMPRLAPSSKPPYQLNKKELQEFKAQINEFMEHGYIRPSESPYGLLVLFVDKKYEKLSMCINYCALNKITIKNN
jgi:hypothetical protein